MDMARVLKISALVIGLTACAVLVIFGFALWVFIPLLPAGIIFVIALQTLKRRPAEQKAIDHEHHKAA